MLAQGPFEVVVIDQESISIKSGTCGPHCGDRRMHDEIDVVGRTRQPMKRTGKRTSKHVFDAVLVEGVNDQREGLTRH